MSDMIWIVVAAHLCGTRKKTTPQINLAPVECIINEADQVPFWGRPKL